VREPRWWWPVVALLALVVAMIAELFAWVGLYLYLHPGEPAADYEAYVELASPVVEIVVGTPAFFVAGRIMRWRAGPLALRPALATLALYVVLEALAIAAFTESTLADAPMVAANWLTKSAATWLGARAGTATA
jgi:hypothetical protein